MSIEKYVDDDYFTTYTPTCDGCGTVLSDETDFGEAVFVKKEAGWKSVKIYGEWCDLCPDCQKKRDNKLKSQANSIVGRRKKK